MYGFGLIPHSEVTLNLSFKINYFLLFFLITIKNYHEFLVLNPAITIALMITRDLNITRGIFYIFAQFIGAIIGSSLAKIFQPVPVAALTTLVQFSIYILITNLASQLLTLYLYFIFLRHLG